MCAFYVLFKFQGSPYYISIIYKEIHSQITIGLHLFIAICANNVNNTIGAFMAEKIRLGYGALSSDTELLTPTGWLNISKVTEETLVAQYSIDGHISFTRPNYIRLEKPEKAIHIYNKLSHYDQLVGIDHAVPYICTYTDNLKVMPANRVTRNSQRKYPHTGILLGGSIRSLSLVDRLRIAFQADGSIQRRGIKSDYIQFSFAKDRKIERLHSLLKAANISDYRTCLKKNEQTQFTFSAPPGFYEKDFSWLDLTNVNQSWCLEFIEELSHWDSHVYESEHFRCQYSNIQKLAIDRVQAVATLGGYKTCLGITPHNNSNHQTNYRLNIFGGSKTTQGNALITETLDYGDLMYGVRVDTNMVVIRRNDAVSITGCGNMLLLKDPVINTDCGHLV